MPGCSCPGSSPCWRVYLGLSLGVLLLMWLPVLWAYAVRFSYAAHWLALARSRCLWARRGCGATVARPRPLTRRRSGRFGCCFVLVVPLTVLGGYLQYTHSIRLAADGTYHVGQSTYGDLSLHLAVCTSIVNASFRWKTASCWGHHGYPYLSDSIATSMLMLGMPLNTAMAFTGTMMMALVYAGYGLLAMQLCRRRGAAALAFFLLFLNGGLGFFYTLDAP